MMILLTYIPYTQKFCVLLTFKSDLKVRKGGWYIIIPGHNKRWQNPLSIKWLWTLPNGLYARSQSIGNTITNLVLF